MVRQVIALLTDGEWHFTGVYYIKGVPNILLPSCMLMDWKNIKNTKKYGNPVNYK